MNDDIPPESAQIISADAVRATRALERAIARYGARLAAAEEVCRIARMTYPELPPFPAARVRDALASYDRARLEEIQHRTPGERA